MDVGLHHAKNWGNKEIPLAILSRTSAKIIQVNEWGCRDGMHNAKNRGNKVIALAILSKDTSTIMSNPFALNM